MAGLSAEQLTIILAELQQDSGLLHSKFGGKLSHINKWKRLAEKLNTVTENGSVKDVSEWQDEFRTWRRRTMMKASTDQQLTCSEQKFMTILQANKGKLKIGGSEIDNVADLYSSDDEDSHTSSPVVRDDERGNHHEAPSGTNKRPADDAGNIEAKRMNLLAAEKQFEIAGRLEALEQPCDHQPANDTLRFMESMFNFMERQAQAREREINAMEQRNEFLRQTIEIFRSRPDLVANFVQHKPEDGLPANASKD